MALEQLESDKPYRVWRIEYLRDFIEFLEQNFCNEFAIFRGQREDWPLIPRVANLHHLRTILESERIIFDTFCREALPFLDREPKNEWEWLAVAQHHGLPTRLLDWSTNALGALWFAVRRPARDATIQGALWVFRPEDQDIIKNPGSGQSPFSGERTQVYLPRHVSGRVRSQEGVFSVHKFMRRSNSFVALEESAPQNRKLDKIMIPARCFPYLRFDLEKCGIHAGSFFPGIDGLAERIRTKHSYLDDEKDFPLKHLPQSSSNGNRK